MSPNIMLEDGQVMLPLHRSPTLRTRDGNGSHNLNLGCLHPIFRCIYFHLKMVVRAKNVVAKLNKSVKTIKIELH
jgi:hypothetical protein